MAALPSAMIRSHERSTLITKRIVCLERASKLGVPCGVPSSTWLRCLEYTSSAAMPSGIPSTSGMLSQCLEYECESCSERMPTALCVIARCTSLTPSKGHAVSDVLASELSGVNSFVCPRMCCNKLASLHSGSVGCVGAGCRNSHLTAFDWQRPQ